LVEVGLFALADITRITGAKRRTVQLWAEAGAIKADAVTERAGSGVHRTFSKEEVIIACVLNGFARNAISIGFLIRTAEVIRHGISIPVNRTVLEDASRGKGINLLMYNGVGRLQFWSSNFPGEMSLEKTTADWLQLKGPQFEEELSYVTVNLNACLRNADSI
jgi:hypothetical protein